MTKSLICFPRVSLVSFGPVRKCDSMNLTRQMRIRTVEIIRTVESVMIFHRSICAAGNQNVRRAGKGGAIFVNFEVDGRTCFFLIPVVTIDAKNVCFSSC